METKHTPGPWIAIKARSLSHIKGSKGEYICSLKFDSKDANLIASTTELLSALKDCEAALRLVERETGKSYAATIVARAAIAKATEE